MRLTRPYTPPNDPRCEAVPPDSGARAEEAGYYTAPSELVEPDTDWRLLPSLRDRLRAALTPGAVPSAVRLLAEAVRRRRDRVLGTDALRRLHAQALADLAVTGRRMYESFFAARPTPSDVAAQVGGSTSASDPDVLAVVNRAYDAAWAIRGAAPRRGLGWISVCAELDPPHRPVNISSAPFAQHDITVNVGATEHAPARAVKSRYVVIPPFARAPVHTPRVGFVLPPAHPLPPPDESRALIYLHGHGSRLEECLHVAHYLGPQGITVVSVDLPGFGCAEAYDHTEIFTQDVDARELHVFPLLEHIEQFVRDFIRQLGPLGRRILAPMGGSLGGNLSLRLGERDSRRAPFFANTIPWSPAGVWTPKVFLLEPIDRVGAGLSPVFARSRMALEDPPPGPEDPRRRMQYFRRVFDEPERLASIQDVGALPEPFDPPATLFGATVGQIVAVPQQSQLWWRDGWPCKQAMIDNARRDRREIYSQTFRRWHWRTAYEQLLFSHQAFRRWDRLQARTLLVTGTEDSGGDLFSHSRNFATLALTTPGSRRILEQTGHSIHDERPRHLADEIVRFLPPRPPGPGVILDWSPWHRLDGHVSGRPHAATLESGRLIVLARDRDGRIWRREQRVVNGDFDTDWAVIAGGLNADDRFGASVAAALHPDGRVRLFAQLSGPQWIAHVAQAAPNGAWENWEKGDAILGQFIGGAVDAVAAIERMDIPPNATRDGVRVLVGERKVLCAARRTNGRIHVRMIDEPRRLPPDPPGDIDLGEEGTTFVGVPALAHHIDARVIVVARATDGTIRHISETFTNGWDASWTAIPGGTVAGDPAVARTTEGRLAVFARGGDGALRVALQETPGGASFSPWAIVGGSLAAGAVPSVILDAWGHLQLFVRWTDGGVRTIRQTIDPENLTAITWGDWHSLELQAAEDPVAAAQADGRLVLFAVGPDRALHVARQSTRVVAAPAAMGESTPTAQPAIDVAQMPVEIEMEEGEGPGKTGWALEQLGLAPPSFDDGGHEFTSNVRGIGEAAIHAVGDRGLTAGKNLWAFTGPRNVGGRVRALAIHPTNHDILYAGSASGGVFKTENGGETWFPLWHDERSLSIGAIAIAESAPDTLFAATGEPYYLNGGSTVAGAGIARSTDGGRTWEFVATAERLDGSIEIEQIAVHPSHPEQVWVVSRRGVFRSTNALAAPAAVTFTAFEPFGALAPRAATHYSDAVFGAAASGAPEAFCLYLCRAKTPRGDIIRIDRPSATTADIQAQLSAAENLARPLPAPGALDAPQTTRARLAVSRSDARFVYVIYSHERHTHLNRESSEPIRAVVRSGNGNRRDGTNRFRNATWTQIPYHPPGDPDAVGFDDFNAERQGSYDLCIAVSPRNHQHVVVGQTVLYLSLDAASAGPQWQRLMPWEPWRFDMGFHADQHAPVFERDRDPPGLWVGNDGGVSFCSNWHTLGPPANQVPHALVPVPPPVDISFRQFVRDNLRATGVVWKKKGHGLHATQMYDLTQSAIVPTMYACGFQDNGLWYTTGGGTWRMAFGADGGFIAFDPVDPYHFVATWQGGISFVDFSGPFQHDVPPPKTFINDFGWPRSLTEGFLRLDKPRFVADTVHHPRKAGRLLTTRQNRVYGTVDGERWAPIEIGERIDIVVTATHPQPTPFDHANIFNDGALIVEVEATPGAAKLGFFPTTQLSTKNQTRNRDEENFPPPPDNPAVRSYPNATLMVSVKNRFAEAYALADGDELILRVTHRNRAGVETPARRFRAQFNVSPEIPDLATATAAQVAKHIRNRLRPLPIGALMPPNLSIQAWPAFANAAFCVEITTTGVGAAQQITIGGTGGLPAALGIVAGTHRGDDGRPASVTLQASRLDGVEFPPPEIQVGAGATLTIQIGAAGPTRTITFDVPPFSDLGSIRAGELAARINAALAAAPAQPARAIAGTMRKSILIRRTDTTFVPAAPVVAASTALARLTTGNRPRGHANGHPTGPDTELRLIPERLWNAFDLSEVVAGTALVLRLTGAAGSFDVTFDAAGFVDRSRATVEEVARKIHAALVPATKLRVDVVYTPSRGDPTEIAYSNARPDTVWVGGTDGTLWVSRDDGVNWTKIKHPKLIARSRPIEAIALHPANPAIVYVGLAGIGVRRTHDPGTLLKTEDGVTWNDVASHGIVTGSGPDTKLLGVNEVIIDPDDGRRLWVATDAGVFESRDAGLTFEAINEGLPNGRVVDLAYVRDKRLLRCGLWGRGTYARSVAAPPAGQVKLYLRASALDDGTRRPADDGYDGFAATPLQAPRGESPDIKVWGARPRTLGPGDETIDGAEFDDDLDHEELGPAGEVRVYIQVHNGSPAAANHTRVVVVWADARNGPPPLDAAFWPSFSPGPPTVNAPWHLIGQATISGIVVADHPRVVSMTFTPPPEIASVDEVAIVVFATCDEDPLSTSERNVVTLLERERKIAMRTTRTRATRDARQLQLRAFGAATFTTAGSAAPILGLGPVAAPGVAFQRGIDPPHDLSPVAGVAKRLEVTDSGGRAARIDFLAEDFDALATPRPAEVRRAINRRLRLDRVAARCILGGVDLSVNGGERLADLVASETEITDAAARRREHELIRRLRKDRLKRAVDNYLYLRIANRGTADEPRLRWRLYKVDPAITPFVIAAANEIGTAEISNLSAGRSEIVQLRWNPGAAAGTHLTIAAVAGSDGDPLRTPLDSLPASWPHFAAFHEYCDLASNVAYRVFELVS